MVGLSTTGQIKIYNNQGTAHAAVDIFGYYIDHHHDDRYYTKTQADSAIENRLAGTVIRGAINVSFTATAANQEMTGAISFGVELAAPPTVHLIEPGQTPPPGCSGTPENPGAGPGHLCVFETANVNVNPVSACIARTAPEYACGLSNTWGASLYIQSAGPGQTISVGSWALGVPAA